MAYKLIFDVVGYKTGEERADTMYVTKAENATYDFEDAADGETDRLMKLGAIADEDAKEPEGLTGEEIFRDASRDPAGDPTGLPREGAEAASGQDPDELKGEKLDQALEEAGIDGSGMKADEKRDALRDYQAGESPDES